MQAQKTMSSVLIYLFADRLVPAKGGMLDQGMEAPVTGAKISVKPLGELLFAAALWELREAGAVALSTEAKKGLLRTKKVLKIERRADAPATAVEGIAAGVLAAVQAGADSPANVARRWLGSSRANPWGDVVLGALSDAVAAGCGDIDGSGTTKMKALLGAVPKFVPNHARAAELEPAFGAFKAAWDHFAATQPELSADLVAQCRSALGSIASTD